MKDIIIKTDKLIITKITEELLLTDKLEDKYIFWEDLEVAGVIVWFNTTDYSNKELVDTWNRVKNASLNAMNMLDVLVA